MDYRVEHNGLVAPPPACKPAVTVSAVGELICALSTRWEPFPRGSELQIIRSRDEGRTWSNPETIWKALDPRASILADVGLMTMRDGNILLPVTYHITPKRDDAPGEPPKGDHDMDCEAVMIAMYDLTPGHGVGHVHCLRSGDHGQTWTNIAVGGAPEGTRFYDFGRIIELQSGDLLLPANGRFPTDPATGRRKGMTGYFRSRNGGWSWGPFEDIDTAWGNETNILERRDGTLLAVIRGMPGQEPSRTFGMVRSADGGRSWSKPKPIGIQGKMPDLWETPDGRLLMAVGCEGCAIGREIYRKRNRRTFNVLFISDDGGETWRRDLELPPLDDTTEVIPCDAPVMVPMDGGRYFIVQQATDRGKERTGHPVDYEYFFSIQGTIITPA